jgi:hypothetical protein
MPSRWWLRVALAILVPAWFLSAARLRMHYLTIVAGGISPPDYGRPAAREHDGGGGGGALLCRRIASSLDPSSWPDAIYHKDRGAPGGDLLGGACSIRDFRRGGRDPPGPSPPGCGRRLSRRRRRRPGGGGEDGGGAR